VAILTGEWFTYRQAAEQLNLSPEAVRQRARRGRWQRTLGNDKRTRVLLPDNWEEVARAAGERASRVRSLDGHVPAIEMIKVLEAHVESLRAHVDMLKTQLTAAELRAEKQAAEFAAHEARLTSDLSVERTLADRMSSRVDQMTAELAAEQAQRVEAEKKLNLALERRWWRSRQR
jgi:hypothetical protein